jgi:integrase
MSIRKRTWTSKNGTIGEAWLVDYVDARGKRRARSFRLKKQADSFLQTITAELLGGVHVPAADSVTIEEAARLWKETCERRGLERSTRDQYEQHARLHIVPFLGRVKLTSINVATVRGFEDALHREGRSAAMIKRVLVSLGALLGDAMERGLVARNLVKDLRSRRAGGIERRAERRAKTRLKIGVDIPTRGEIKAVLSATTDGYARALLTVAVFAGLRASELRGLRWSDIDFKAGELHVSQRADRYAAIGRPKTEAGERTIPLPARIVHLLKEWRLQCPKGSLGLVFPNRAADIADHGNIIARIWLPTQVAAGVTSPVTSADGTPMRDAEGRPVLDAKYPGLHALRHFNASWLINRKADGGCELPPKTVQTRLGHSSITVTLDTYGHMFPAGDDHAAELSAAADTLLG